MKLLLPLIFLFLGAARPAPAQTTPAAPGDVHEPASCQNVRFSDVGWTDVTSTTALITQLLRTIGYTPTTTVLSVPVTYASMQHKDIDVFLGDWMPTQEADIKPYLNNGSVTVVGANLLGAKYSLAVPAYAYDAGLKDFNDIHSFAAALNNSVYRHRAWQRRQSRAAENAQRTMHSDSATSSSSNRANKAS